MPARQEPSITETNSFAGRLVVGGLACVFLVSVVVCVLWVGSVSLFYGSLWVVAPITGSFVVGTLVALTFGIRAVRRSARQGTRSATPR